MNDRIPKFVSTVHGIRPMKQNESPKALKWISDTFEVKGEKRGYITVYKDGTVSIVSATQRSTKARPNSDRALEIHRKRGRLLYQTYVTKYNPAFSDMYTNQH